MFNAGPIELAVICFTIIYCVEDITTIWFIKQNHQTLDVTIRTEDK